MNKPAKSLVEIKQNLSMRIISMEREIVELEEWRHRESKEVARSEQSLLLEIISVLDALEDLVKRETDATREEPKSLERVCRKVRRLLESRGVTLITFPANKAQIGLAKIVETQPSSEVPEGTILGEVRKGYTRTGQVLRPAELITAVRPQSPHPLH